MPAWAPSHRPSSHVGTNPPASVARTVEGMGLLSNDEIQDALADMDGWTYVDDALTKTFEFDDFASVIAFMADVRPAIDDLNHHPEWTNVYNRLDVRLTSHAAGGVTERDFTLARLLEEHRSDHPS